MKNILEICQEVADITTTQRPTDLFDKQSSHSSIFLSVAKSELNSLMRYGNWQDITKEAKFRTVKGKTSYPLDNICSDFYSILNNTVYIQNKEEQVIGSITSEQFMRQKFFCCPSLNLKFKIQGNAIKFLEAPQEDLTIIFNYRSSMTCYDADTYEEKPIITKNTDKPIFDEFLVQLGITWRWLNRNGMSYEEEYNEYQEELKKKFATGIALTDINLISEDSDDGLGEVYVKACK